MAAVGSIPPVVHVPEERVVVRQVAGVGFDTLRHRRFAVDDFDDLLVAIAVEFRAARPAGGRDLPIVAVVGLLRVGRVDPHAGGAPRVGGRRVAAVGHGRAGQVGRGVHNGAWVRPSGQGKEFCI